MASGSTTWPPTRLRACMTTWPVPAAVNGSRSVWISSRSAIQ
jgi:hypothetical protein